MSRILYLAVADARGHLMRAHLLAEILAPRGISLDVVTTSRAGQEFLAAFGTPSRVLSEHFRVEFDDRHTMTKRATERRLLRYLLSPKRCWRDARWLAARAERADLVVNDSLHPALLFAPSRLPVVHVYADNLWRAAETNFSGRTPALVERRYRWGMRYLRDRSLARVVHTLGDAGSEGAVHRLPPLVARPARRPEQVRRDLGLAPGQRLATVYLNPHYQDPALAACLETTLRGADFHVHAVGEGYARRPGWIARDTHLVDSVAAADLFVSGGGMGGIGQATAFGVPMLALLGDQPEQERNIEQALAASVARIEPVQVQGVDLTPRLAAAIERLGDHEPPWHDPIAGVERVHRQWAETFERLLERSKPKRRLHGYPRPASEHRARPRDQQPARRASRRRPHRREPHPPAAPPA